MIFWEVDSDFSQRYQLRKRPRQSYQFSKHFHSFSTTCVLLIPPSDIKVWVKDQCISFKTKIIHSIERQVGYLPTYICRVPPGLMVGPGKCLTKGLCEIDFPLKLDCQIKRRNCPLLITRNRMARILPIRNSSSVLVLPSRCVTRMNNTQNKNKPHLNKKSFDFIRFNIKYMEF